MPLQKAQTVVLKPSRQELVELGKYNRESGEKTLIFVCVLILTITALSVVSLYLLNRKSQVLIQSNAIEKSSPPVHPPK